jgi:uncharacterized protein (TIGR03083 family)
MALAATEYDRFVAAVVGLRPDDWSRPTDNDLWDVKAMLGHVLGAMESNASVREAIRQQTAAAKAAKATGVNPVDATSDLQVKKHAALSAAELVARTRAMAPKALKGRRRTPAPMRAIRITPGPPFEGKWKLGYLIDTIYTRDTWMHRVDLCRATGQEMVVTPDHDGRIVADVVREWATTHGQPVTLVLTGPAGGTYTQGEGGEHHELDAVEFCRITSGRAAGPALLTQGVAW